MRRVKFYHIILLIFFGNNSFSSASEVIFQSNVQFKKNEQTNFESLNAGESLNLKSGESAFIITPQNIPLLVYAIQKDGSKITVADSNVSTAIAEQLQPSLQKATTEIIEGLRKAEALVQKRDFSQAASITSSLKEKYRNISSVLFMSGTVFYLMNNKTSAVEDLQNGLRLDPNNEPAKKLLGQLKGAP